MDKIKIGIIGMGNMGCKYAEQIATGEVPGMELGAVTRIKREWQERAKSVLPPGLPVYQTAEELLDCGSIDAVLIATPHYAHQEQTVAALQRGLHVLCDKPAGVYTAQARAMNEEAATHELVYGMMFNQRTDPLYRTIKELVESGRYGKLKRVNWIVTDWYRPEAYYRAVLWRGTWEKDGGGVLLNQCPHNLDLLQWICGMPVMVRAFCHEGKWHDIEVEDEVTAYLEFPGGATGVFIASTGEAPGTNRLEIVMEDGRIVSEDGALSVYELEGKEREFCRNAEEAFGKPAGHSVPVQPKGENLQHLGILRNFAEAVLNGQPLIAPGCEGLNSLMLSNAMYLSSWLDRPVQLPVDEELFMKELNRKKARAAGRSEE